MRTSKHFVASSVVLILLVLSVPGRGIASDTSLHKSVNGIDVYLAVLPAEMIRGHPKAHDESQMHGGITIHQHHIMVALFDKKSGSRIKNASIYARIVAADGVTKGPRKLLQQMLAGNAETYGNYFTFPGRGPFRIKLQIDRPGSTKTTWVSFQWTRV